MEQKQALGENPIFFVLLNLMLLIVAANLLGRHSPSAENDFRIGFAVLVSAAITAIQYRLSRNFGFLMAGVGFVPCLVRFAYLFYQGPNATSFRSGFLVWDGALFGLFVAERLVRNRSFCNSEIPNWLLVVLAAVGPFL